MIIIVIVLGTKNVIRTMRKFDEIEEVLFSRRTLWELQEIFELVFIKFFKK